MSGTSVEACSGFTHVTVRRIGEARVQLRSRPGTTGTWLAGWLIFASALRLERRTWLEGTN